MFEAIISRNLRDTATGAPKVLLRNIIAEGTQFRDHAWVELNQEIDYLLKHCKLFRRKSGNGAVKIQFNADIKEYKYRDEVVKQTLASLKDITVVGKA